MKSVLSTVIVLLLLSPRLSAQLSSPDAAELSRLLKDFLAGASRNDAAMHDRFWAEDLIYTGSAGRRIGKADIIRGLRQAAPPTSGEPMPTYSAEDIRIQQYGDTAIVAFRLIGTTVREGQPRVATYLNSGTFLKRNGIWQVVSWQSTRMPRSEADARADVAAAETAFHQAILAADTRKLESLADERFIWTHRDGTQMTRRELIDQLGSRQLRYSKLETTHVTVSLYGDTAIVRGSSPRQRSAFVGSPAGDASPFTAFYTLTFVNTGGDWKAVAMHSSRAQ